jgi:hypothetical protein
MAIKEFNPLQVTQRTAKKQLATPSYFANEQDVDETVAKVIESLEANVDGFRTASQMYDSEFFENEDPRFVQKLAGALTAFFSDTAVGMKNNLWIKLGQ